MNKFQVYPNPSNGIFNITTVEAVSVKVFDNVGRYVDEFNMNGSHNFGSNYATGLYHVQLINSDGVVKTLKIVKEYWLYSIWLKSKLCSECLSQIEVSYFRNFVFKIKAIVSWFAEITDVLCDLFDFEFDKKGIGF